MTSRPDPPEALPQPPERGRDSGPVLALLAAGLQLWVRSRCEGVDSLELQLHGSALQLLRGQLEGVTLMARRVTYQGLQIERVQLRSEALRVRIGPWLRTRTVTLEHPFAIVGQVAFSADGLTRSLARPQWRSLSDQLGETLFGLVPLLELRIARDQLIFVAAALGEHRGVELETRPVAVDGSVELLGLDGRSRARLPMDPNIHIDRVSLEGEMLRLDGEARVTP